MNKKPRIRNIWLKRQFRAKIAFLLAFVMIFAGFYVSFSVDAYANSDAYESLSSDEDTQIFPQFTPDDRFVDANTPAIARPITPQGLHIEGSILRWNQSIGYGLVVYVNGMPREDSLMPANITHFDLNKLGLEVGTYRIQLRAIGYDAYSPLSIAVSFVVGGLWASPAPHIPMPIPVVTPTALPTASPVSTLPTLTPIAPALPAVTPELQPLPLPELTPIQLPMAETEQEAYDYEDKLYDKTEDNEDESLTRAIPYYAVNSTQQLYDDITALSTVTVSDATQFNNAINNAAVTAIEVASSITLTQSIAINRPITFTGAGVLNLQNNTINVNATGSLGSLTLSGPTITNGNVAVLSAGTFTMNSGAVQNFSNGNGVSVFSGATFTMNGGTIQNNQTGVHVFRNATFNFNGGNFINNTQHNIFNTGTINATATLPSTGVTDLSGNMINIILDPAGGQLSVLNIVHTTPQTIQFAVNQQAQASGLPSAARTGYTFVGWFNAANQELTATTIITADMVNTTFIARYMPASTDTFTVTFNIGAGITAWVSALADANLNNAINQNITGSFSRTVQAGQTLGVGFPAVTRMGFSPPTWFIQGTGASLNANTPVNGNIIVNANWLQAGNMVTISFNAGGGTFTSNWGNINNNWNNPGNWWQGSANAPNVNNITSQNPWGWDGARWWNGSIWLEGTPNDFQVWLNQNWGNQSLWLNTGLGNNWYTGNLNNIWGGGNWNTGNQNWPNSLNWLQTALNTGIPPSAAAIPTNNPWAFAGIDGGFQWHNGTATQTGSMADFQAWLNSNFSNQSLWQPNWLNNYLNNNWWSGNWGQNVNPGSVQIPIGTTLAQAGYSASWLSGLVTRSGHTFNGWVLPNGNEFNINTIVSSNVTVTAQWVSPTATPTPAPTATPAALPPGQGASAAIPTLTPQPTPQATPQALLPQINVSALFSDVSANEWFAPYITTVWLQNLFTGTGAGMFSPHINMSRAMFTQVFANFQAIIPGVGQNFFSDVAPNAWYANVVSWAASIGLVNGTGPGMFSPESPVTREQMAVMLHRFAQINNIDLPQTNVNIGFIDQASVAPWATQAVAAMSAAGIIQGRLDGSFDPQATATRAEVAAIFARFVNIAR